MYLGLKLLHVLAVVVFLGNIGLGVFWHRIAMRTRDARILGFTMGGVILSDRLFTVPGVTVLVTTGILAAIQSGTPLLRTPWVLGGIVLISLSGVIFSAVLAPLQRRMHALALAGDRGGAFDFDAYHALTRRWEAWGALALLAPLAALVLMVLKPGS